MLVCDEHAKVPSFKSSDAELRYCSQHKVPHLVNEFDGDARACRRVHEQRKIWEANRKKKRAHDDE